MSATPRDIRPLRKASYRWRFPDRALHVVDIENLAGAAVPSLDLVSEVQVRYLACLGFGADDQVVLAASHLALLNAGLGWPHARHLVRSGKDGADLELIDVLEHENVAARFSHVVIASGDGLFGAAAAMIALREAERKGGSGQVIDLPLLEPLFNILGPQAANLRLTGKVKLRTGNRSTTTAPRNAYRTKDGRWVCLSASIQKMAERLFRAIGRPELIDDPRYATNSERLRHADELDAIIGAFIAQRTQAENVEFFEKFEVTIGPVYDIAQILEDPHVTERELVADYPDPDMGSFPMHHVTPRLSRTPGAIRAPAPKLGEHNGALLAEIGVDETAYAKLVAAGIVCEGGAAPKGDQE